MHDAKGRALKVGDRVLIPAVIEECQGGEDYCNVRAKSTFGRRPDGHKESFSGINAGVFLRANDGDENDLVEAFTKVETLQSGGATSNA